MQNPHLGEVFNSQKLLFGMAQPITEEIAAQVPEDFYEQGWAVIDDVPDAFTALGIQESLIKNIDPARVPLHRRFSERVQLAKADEIPVCEDILATSYQVLHFDMGHPFVENADPLVISHVGLYRSLQYRHIFDTPTAETRIISLAGLTSLLANIVESRLAAYAGAHGDGWVGHNTGRIAAGVRLLDALSDSPRFQDERDKTVGQWFSNDQKVDSSTAFEHEAAFYAEHGIDLREREQRVALKAGQLLFLDNTRVLHGRMGKRSAKEVLNFMFGIEALDQESILALRQNISQLLVAKV